MSIWPSLPRPLQLAHTICAWSFLAAFARSVEPDLRTNPAPSHSGHVSLREKKMGKAVPTSATATAPAMRYVLPSAATSPTARATVAILPPGAAALLLPIDGSGTALRRGGRSPDEGVLLLTAATAGEGAAAIFCLRGCRLDPVK